MPYKLPHQPEMLADWELTASVRDLNAELERTPEDEAADRTILQELLKAVTAEQAERAVQRRLPYSTEE
jgi:hypothetical protein